MEIAYPSILNYLLYVTRCTSPVDQVETIDILHI